MTSPAEDITSLEGEPLRNRGARSLLELIEYDQRYLFYLYNGGPGRDGDQQIQLRLATDVDHAPNSDLGRRLHWKTLILSGVEKGGDYRDPTRRFLLIHAGTLRWDAGRTHGWSQPAWVEFADDDRDGKRCGFPPALLSILAALPEADSQREAIHQRLADWRRYLEILERRARKAQFNVSFRAWRRERGGKQITFILDPPPDLVRMRMRSAHDQQLHLADIPSYRTIPEVLAAYANEEAAEFETHDWLMGTIEGYPTRDSIRVLLEEDIAERLVHGNAKIPATGILRYKAMGDLAQFQYLRKGLEALEQGRSENPRLGDFLFDAYRARLPDPKQRSHLSLDQLLQAELNPGQRAAVEGALNAPDLYLIQGPPGTGKTTVIAEICYQVALRGGRTLVASQANLAVDHALSRLVHHPSIRVLRRGRAERVEEEGRPYVEDQVIATWLSKTAEACRQDLEGCRARVEALRDLSSLRAQLEDFAARADGYTRLRSSLLDQITQDEAMLDDQQNQLARASQAAGANRRAQAFLLQARESEQPTLEGTIPGFALDLDDDALSLILDHSVWCKAVTALETLVAEVVAWDHDLAISMPHSEPRAGFHLPAGDHAGTVAHDEGTRQAILEYPQSAQIAIEASQQIQVQVGDLGPRLDRFTSVATGWYEADRREKSLLDRKGQLAQQHTDGLAMAEALKSQLAHLEQRMNDLGELQIRVKALGPEIASRLQEIMTTAGQDLRPPAALSDPVAAEVWALALEAVEVPSLRSMSAAHAAAADGARELNAAVQWLNTWAGRLAAETTPQLLAAEERKAPEWSRSKLGNLVILNAQGDFHLAAGADAALERFDKQLQGLCVQRTGLVKLLGGEGKRQAEAARWVAILRRTVAAFVARTADLENQADALATRIHRKGASCTRNLEPAIQREASRLAHEARSTHTATRARLLQVRDAIVASLKQSATLDPTLSQLASIKARLRTEMAAGLGSHTHLTPVEPLEHLAQQVSLLPEEEWMSDWQAARQDLDAKIDRLTRSASAISPALAISELLEALDKKACEWEAQAAASQTAIHELSDTLDSIRTAARLAEEEFIPARDRWLNAHAQLAESMRPAARGRGADDPAYLAELQVKSAEWTRDLKTEQARLTRIEGLVSDWIYRIEAKDERDEADLRQIYIDNANVIGITCVQAGSRRFSEEYRNFDYVIIDEVSKATPPELLLPMLKGARIVLVGDSRQLPPMIGPKALTDLAEELGVPAEDVDHIKRSMFKELFEKCPDDLRSWLTDQYRMHPQIMDAINQFYADKLVCAIPDPDQARSHDCTPLFEKKNHIVWVPVPIQKQFHEIPVGTSFRNDVELDIIEQLVERLDAAWQANRGDRPNKEVGVITFYAVQANTLRKMLIERSPNRAFQNLNIRVGTVDRFQGMERPIVIASLVRNNNDGNIGFAKELERINVAFSRAQELLVIVGSRELFCDRAEQRTAATRYLRVADVVKRNGGLVDFSAFFTH